MLANSPALRLGIFAVASLLACQPVLSDVVTGEVIYLAELIVAPDKGGAKTSSGARNQRERAGSYQSEAPVNSEAEEYGLMSPRSGSPSEEKAYENRVKAKLYQQSGEYAPQPLPVPGVMPGVEGTQSRPAEQRNRARAYSGTGNGQDIDLSNVGRDGIPLVPCRDVDNVSGRIGDDTSSGSLVFIIRNGQQVKARCR